MSPRAWAWVLGATLVALAAAASLLTVGRGGAEGSSLSTAPRGLVAARRYLEERGTTVRLLDQALGAGPTADVLVAAFPFQRATELDAIHDVLRTGATVVYAFSGDGDGMAEGLFADALGLTWVDPRGDPPLGPRAWRAFAAARWILAPESPGAAALDVRIPRRFPRAPREAETLFRAPGGEALVFRYSTGRGRVLVLPAEVLANAGLARAGHLDLLERLRREYAGTWTFDEFHHGLLAPGSPAQAAPLHILDLYLLHLALLYGLALLAVARRFGPAWSDPPVAAGSAGAFLVGVGALHHRLGHHADALRLLAARARELQPHADLQAPPGADGGPAALVALACALARQQRQPKRTS